MSVTMIETEQPEVNYDSAEDASQYRALHVGAILGALIAMFSLIYPLTVGGINDMGFMLGMAAVPLVAIVVCVFAVRAIQTNREIYTGAPVAKAGVVVALLSLVSGTAYGAYILATEVPEGYQRTSFAELKPSEEDEEAGSPIPAPILTHMKQSNDVFIKGYIRPSSVSFQKGNKEFLLVRDNRECCFGDLSKVQFYDQVMVQLEGDLTADFERRVFRVGGKLSVRRGMKSGEPLLVYSMEADYIK